jgi:predicted nucleic acid-binding protein
MILADTSVWIDYFRARHGPLRELLRQNDVLAHPFVIGELACGGLPSRVSSMALLRDLPITLPAAYNEVLLFIETHRLMATGLGYIDVHLLAAAAKGGHPLYTRDKRLHAAASTMSLAYLPSR